MIFKQIQTYFQQVNNPMVDNNTRKPSGLIDELQTNQTDFASPIFSENFKNQKLHEDSSQGRLNRVFQLDENKRNDILQFQEQLEAIDFQFVPAKNKQEKKEYEEQSLQNQTTQLIAFPSLSTLDLIDHFPNDFHFNEIEKNQRIRQFPNESLAKIENITTRISIDVSEFRTILTNHPTLNSISREVNALHEFVHTNLAEISNQVSLQKCEETKDEMAAKPLLQTHSNVKCNGCVAFSIRGKRWKCLECADFNLCGRCEKKTTHDHIMIRFNDPIPKQNVDCFSKLSNLQCCFQNNGELEIRRRILMNAANRN